MRNASRLVGATLVYPATCGPPDLALALQFLLDDLRADGRRVSSLRLGGRSLRLRLEAHDLVLTQAETPLPHGAFDGLRRPTPTESDLPDLARSRLARTLATHAHALGVLVRRRGALPEGAEGTPLSMARDGQRLLLPVIEAAPPALLIWQPGGLLLGAEEFLALDPEVLIRPGDPAGLLRLGHHRVLSRSEGNPLPQRRGPPASRLDRAERVSAGHLFGTERSRPPPPLPRLEAPTARVTQALRDCAPPPTTEKRPATFRASCLAVLVLWCALLPQIATLQTLLP